MANLWAGRFSKALDSSVNDFNSSIRFDCRMYRADIKGSIAHARMLGKQGIIVFNSLIFHTILPFHFQGSAPSAGLLPQAL